MQKLDCPTDGTINYKSVNSMKKRNVMKQTLSLYQALLKAKITPRTNQETVKINNEQSKHEEDSIHQNLDRHNNKNL